MKHGTPGPAPATPVTIDAYAAAALPRLGARVAGNRDALEAVVDRLVADVEAGKSLFVFGSGHAAIFALELYHRAGGASFVVPIVADYLLPNAGPPIVRAFERAPAAANALLARAEPRPGEMVWIASQSGINPAVVDFALEAKRRGLYTVAFTSREHSAAVDSRHASGRRLFEVCDVAIDLGGVRGDALVPIGPNASAGAFSSLSAILLGHSLLVAACARLEAKGVRCTYTSVNTPEGEARNRDLEAAAAARDPLLRG